MAFLSPYTLHLLHHMKSPLLQQLSPSVFVSNEKPEHLLGDRAYDSDPLDARLAVDHEVELIAPQRYNRQAPRTQDGRPLRRYRHRWRIERLFAWLQNFRRIPIRYEYHAENFLGLIQLGCI